MPKLPTLRQATRLEQVPSFTGIPELAQRPGFQAPSTVRQAEQIIEDRYIDEMKLLEFCKQRFGLGNYRLRVR
jgi:hypothetical protein